MPAEQIQITTEHITIMFNSLNIRKPHRTNLLPHPIKKKKTPQQ